MVPTLGIMLASGGMAIIIQTVFVYIALAYPQHAASLFGDNRFNKSTTALAAILVGPPLYEALGVIGVHHYWGDCVSFASVVYIFYMHTARSLGGEVGPRPEFLDHFLVVV